MFKCGDKIGLIACSNGIAVEQAGKITNLIDKLENMGLIVVYSDALYRGEFIYSVEAQLRAKILNNYYKDKNIKAIFDVSGGDIANELLPFIDFEIIKNNPKPFWGYSDLTTIINAIYCKTQNESYLYQIKNLVDQHGDHQTGEFINTVIYGNNDLYDFPVEFIQGTTMAGIIIGGNIRCLLKLAGTQYMPDFSNKLLFLESNSGNIAKMITYLSQLQQIGAFGKIKGLLLGTFSEMEKTKQKPEIIDLVRKIVDNNLPIARTKKIGHGSDSKCLIIGKYYSLFQ